MEGHQEERKADMGKLNIEISRGLLEARKRKDKVAVSILGVVLGEMQNAGAGRVLSENEEMGIVSKVIKSNRKTMDLMEGGDGKKVLEEENRILEGYLPKKMEVKDIAGFLKGLGFSGGMGEAVAKLKEAGKMFDGRNVKEALEIVKKADC